MIAQAVENCVAVILYNDGDSRHIERGGEEYDEIICAWREMTRDSLDMPAYGVSLDELTKNQMQQGKWLEFVFEKECSFNQLPFNKLAFKIEEGACGFNLIRFTKGYGYFGRCFYIQLNNKTTTSFVQTIGHLFV